MLFYLVYILTVIRRAFAQIFRKISYCLEVAVLKIWWQKNIFFQIVISKKVLKIQLSYFQASFNFS